MLLHVMPRASRSDAYSCSLMRLLYRLPKGDLLFVDACCKDAKASFPLPLTGLYSLEGTTTQAVTMSIPDLRRIVQCGWVPIL